MSQANRCPECGSELPAGSLDGLCPKCLLAAGLESRDDENRPARSGAEAPTTPHSGSFVAPQPASLAAHFPQLEILELLGQGGMGAVYKARQPRLDRFVALKIIRPESADTPAFAERFNREARMLARLNHPQIVGVYDFGNVDISLREMIPDAERKEHTELYYFLMEYVDGPNLRELMRTGELTPPQALAIVPQICEALQFAHDEGVVHRDIKPENILLDKRGRVKIADFGLAKLAGRTPEEFTLTGTHQVMGTPRYMAPEQMEGSHAVDHRADIYSLGVVFYEMLTGEVPIGHFEPPSKKVEVDVRLDEVVLRALAREPERRYQQASDVKSEVESISKTPRPAQTLAAAAFAARPESRLMSTVEPSRNVVARRSVLPLATSLLAFVVILCGIGIPFVPWGGLLHYDAAPGFGWWQGMLVCSSFAAALFVLTATLPWRQIPVWRPIFFALAGIVAIAGACSYIVQRTNGSLPVQPLLAAAGRSLEIDGKTPATVNDAKRHVVVEFSSGPYVAIGLAAAMMLIAGIEIAMALHGNQAPGMVQSRPRSPISAPHSETAANEAQIESARQIVQLPAIGLIAIGALSLALGTLVALTMSTWALSYEGGGGTQLLLALPAILLFTLLPTAMIVGGVKMLRLTSHPWAVRASVLAVSPIPAGPLWLLSLPLGIWSLVVLAKPEVKRGFVLRAEPPRPQAPAEPDAAQSVQNPAWGLIITGIISWITIPLAYWLPIVRELDAAQRTVFQISFGVVPLVVGTTMALAGFCMRRLEGYRLAIFAAVLPIVVLVLKLVGLSFGTLAINPADWVGAPIGLWALVVLSRSDVRSAFLSKDRTAIGGHHRVAPSFAAGLEDSAAVRQQLTVPATLLQIAGLFLFPAAIAIAVLHMLGMIVEDALLTYGIVIAMLIVGGLLFVSGWRLKRLQDYGLGFATCILMLPVTTVVPAIFLFSNSPGLFAPLFLLFPVAVWLLVVLRKPAVKAAFLGMATSGRKAEVGELVTNR